MSQRFSRLRPVYRSFESVWEAACERVFTRRQATSRRAARRAQVSAIERMEPRLVLSAAQNVVQLTALRADPAFAAIDGQLDSGQKIGVAVLDSGSDARHPDLQSNFIAWFDAVATNAAGDVGVTPGTTDITQTRDPDGHGTHVSGTAVSSNLDIGTAVNAGLIGVRTLPASNEVRPNFDTLVSALTWVLENNQTYNIKVVNMSLGFPGVHTNTVPALTQVGSLIKSLEAAGVTVVSASGNSYGFFEDLARTPADRLGVSDPAVFSTLNVASSWEDAGVNDQLPYLTGAGGPISTPIVLLDGAPSADQLSAFSQRSTLGNQVVAPGQTIFSTLPGGQFGDQAGTSMASPMVAGIAALMQDAAMTFGGRYLQPDEVRSILLSTADIIIDNQNAGTQSGLFLRRNPDGSPNISNIRDLLETGEAYSRVNVLNAVTAIKDMFATPTPPPPPPPPPGPPTPPPVVNKDLNSKIDTAIVVPQFDSKNAFTQAGNIGLDGTVDVGVNDIDLYEFTLTTSAVVAAGVSPVVGGQSVNSQLRVFNAAGAQMAIGDGTAYPRVTTGRLAAGTYYVGVSAKANVSYDIVTGEPAQNGLARGDYQINLSVVSPDPDGSISGANTVPLGSPTALNPVVELANRRMPLSNRVQEKLGSDPNPTRAVGQTGRIQVGSADVDVYQVLGPDDGNLYINLDTFAGTGLRTNDGYVRVYSQTSDGTVRQLAAGQANGQSRGGFLTVAVRLGETYFVAVSTNSNTTYDVTDPFGRTASATSTENYDLYFSYSNGDSNGTIYTAIDTRLLDDARTGTVSGLSIGGDMYAAIPSPTGAPSSAVGAKGGFKDVDFYAYTAPTAGVLEVTVNSPSTSLVPALSLWDVKTGQGVRQLITRVGDSVRGLYQVGAGQQVFFSITGQGNENANWFSVGSGSGGDIGGYDFQYRLLGTDALKTLKNDSINTHTPDQVFLNAPVFENIGLDGDLAVGATDIDMFEFTPTKTMSVEIRTNTTAEGSADTFLRVFDSTGKPLVFNDNADGRTQGSRVVLTVRAGQKYFVGVNGSSVASRAYNPLTGERAAIASQTGAYQLQIREISQPIIATGVEAGSPPNVQVFSASTGQPLYGFFAYREDFTGGVKVATGDVNGDGTADIVTAKASGDVAHIKVFNGKTGRAFGDPKYDFVAYGDGYVSGVDLAVADVNGDGFADIITGTVAGSSHVKVFSGKDGSELHSFFAFTESFPAGIRVSAGDVTGDGAADVVVVAGTGAPSHIKTFDGRTGLLDSGPVGQFYAHAPGYRGGVDIAVGDVDGDGFADILTGTSAGIRPHVKVFSGKNRSVLNSFHVYDPASVGGIRVAAADLNGDGRSEILVSPQTGTAFALKAFDARTQTETKSIVPYKGRVQGGYDVSASGPIVINVGTPVINGSTAAGLSSAATVTTATATPLAIANASADAIIATGTAGGVSPHIKVFEASTLRERLSFFAFDPGYLGGVNVATGDVTGDGLADVVVATAGSDIGTFSVVRVFDGRNGVQYSANGGLYTPAPLPFFGNNLIVHNLLYTNGLQVAIGDIDGDGFGDIITGTNAGVGPHVKVHSGRTGAELRSFFAFEGTFAQGLKVASGDINRDGFDDLVITALATNGSNIIVLDGRTNAQLPGTIGSFIPFQLGTAGDIDVAVADVDRDGFDDIIASSGPGFLPRVLVYSGRTGTVIRDITPFESTARGGLSVGAADVDGDGFADIVVGVGSSDGPRVQTISGRTNQQLPSRTGSFYAYSRGYQGGFDLGASGRATPARPPIVFPLGGGSSLNSAFAGLADQLLTAGV